MKISVDLKKKFVRGLAILMLLSISSCGKNIAFQNSIVVPAANGAVNVTKDSNKNYLIKIKISDLAEVNRLQPSKNVYVVWMETDGDNVRNIGQIKSDSGFLSSKLRATFETVTAYKPSKVFITAEDDGDVQYPGMQMILSTNQF
ncbi:hypothetical protein EKM02_10350 [Flavobacterium sp. RSP49]|uniref:hypothetical protein n=1 Tax=unclassified Flavobacterium TaxID=196869 RepID=UPI000F827E91|nr:MULTISPECIES: hypothetical protein [unclassified Flavobacterium]RTY87307.1 hypothetical protein EKM00_06285 [Flavobacterium sp. RSP15]RTY99291.1 hypothetical protein EKM02_10350 [Flavobacterium sp. RSP49]